MPPDLVVFRLGDIEAEDAERDCICQPFGEAVCGCGPCREWGKSVMSQVAAKCYAGKAFCMASADVE